eukprot:scaffold76417_cov39-Tisochrysis_lutea.AAC.3
MAYIYHLRYAEILLTIGGVEKGACGHLPHSPARVSPVAAQSSVIGSEHLPRLVSPSCAHPPIRPCPRRQRGDGSYRSEIFCPRSRAQATKEPSGLVRIAPLLRCGTKGCVAGADLLRARGMA